MNKLIYYMCYVLQSILLLQCKTMKIALQSEISFDIISTGDEDGSERKAVGTMDPALMDLPEKKTQTDVDKSEKKEVKSRKLPADSVFYYDLEAKGFRSFKMENFIGYI